MTVDLDALLAQARLPERTVALCLRGDLQARFEELERQLAAAQAQPAEKLTDAGRARQLAEQMEALRGEMSDSTMVFTLRALPRSGWISLLTAHPAKDKEDEFDAETLEPALIRASIVDPVLTDEQWARLDETLTSAQYGELSGTAWELNRRPVDVPFSPAASRMLQASEPTSRRRSGSASA